MPIVASDVPSIREVLDESMALFVPPSDEASLASGIEEVLHDLALAELRAICAKEAVGAYSWDTRGEKIIAVCRAARTQTP